jgi:AGCS family alanine or glycine:cation symporter
MESIKGFVESASDLLWNTPEVFPIMVILLLSTGVFLTLKLRFIQFRRLWHSVLVVAGKYDDPEDAGDVSHFQALSAALSATVGIGNIAGVATAIHYGGPGAVFWLWVTGFIGMATKFTECTLAHKYRKIHQDGSISGGPMYYMRDGLGGRWTWVGMVFAVCAVVSSFGSGNAVQAFTMADSFRTDFGIPPWISGLVSATLVAFVILGGIKRIGAVASKLVPFMGLMYVVSALAVIIMNIEHLPMAISTIVEQAFTPSAGIGGFAGSTFIFTLTWGVKRGLFSNEAGQGSAPIAHAAAKTKESVSEGSVALLEPFIDTVVICAMTGLVIVITGTWNERFDDRVNLSARSDLTVVSTAAKVGVRGVVADEDLLSGEFTIDAGQPSGFQLVRNHSTVEELGFAGADEPFSGRLVVKEGRIEKVVSAAGTEVPVEEVFAAGKMLYNGSPVTAMSYRIGLKDIMPNGNLLVTIAVFLFALSTAISWSYYGDRAAEYVFGPKAVLPYRAIFVVTHFLGAIFSLELVWGFADVALGIMAIPNLFAILLLSRFVKREANDYYRRMGYKKGL